MCEEGGQRRDVVHVHDVARAFATALTATNGRSVSHRAYNVGSGVVSTIMDLARAMSVSRQGPARVVTGDFRLGDVRHITASSQRILTELGWSATVSLTEGVSGLTFG